MTYAFHLFRNGRTWDVFISERPTLGRDFVIAKSPSKMMKNAFYFILNPADTDVFKTSSGPDQTRLCHVVWKKTWDLQRLEDVEFTTSWRSPIWDVLKTSDLRRLEDIWFMSSWRRPIYNVLKTSDLWRLEDVCKTTSVQQRRSTSVQRRKKWFFLILYCLKYSENFSVFQFRLVFRYGILYKSMDWFIYDRNLRHERSNHT